ncbi:hypothetical protein HGD87_05265 [Rhodobacteraceae bacterium R_SAG9]|nr:hypothetical protein [Rhodobacteraceae bacterium R_SAG9]
MNSLGFDIFWRPKGPHVVVDIDNADDDIWHTMIMDGLSVSLLTQTSASNYQAWISLARSRNPIDQELSTSAQRMLTFRYGGDKCAVGAGRFGRLPGYTNRKPEHQRADGSWRVVGIRNGTLLRNQPMNRVCHQTVEEAAMRLAEEKATRLNSPRERSASGCETDLVCSAGLLPNDMLPDLTISEDGNERAVMAPFHVSDMWTAVPGKDRSTIDWYVAKWLRTEGVNIDEATRILAEFSPKAQERRDPREYAERTVRRSWRNI